MPEISPALYRAGEGEPLVLLHGFTATWRCWLPNLAELVPRFDVIAPTLHGHDGGPLLPDGKTAKSTGEAADHVEEQLDEHGIGDAHFAGNSMGGALALELAKRGRARSVVAISSGDSPASRRLTASRRNSASVFAIPLPPCSKAGSAHSGPDGSDGNETVTAQDESR